MSDSAVPSHEKTKENPGRRKHTVPGWVKILALVLALLMVFEIWLTGMISIKEANEEYLGEFLELAQQTTLEDTDYLQESDFKRAWRILRHTIGKPDSAEDYETFASVSIAQGDYAAALDYMRGCVDAFDGADEELAVLYVRLGSLQMLNGEELYSEAKASFTEALRLDPTLANAWLLRAQLELEEEDYDSAVYDVTQYKLYGDDVEILAAIAPLYEAVGDYASALECYTAALDNPDTYEVSQLKSRGVCYLQLEDTAAAKEDLERFFAEGGSDSDGSVRLLLALCRLSEGDYSGAVATFDRAMELGADGSSLYPQMIPCAYACEKYDRVLAYADAALALECTAAEESQWRLWKGLSYLAQSEFGSALEELQAAMAADASTEDLYYYAGVTAISLENYELAAEYFTQSLEREEDTEACAYNRGVCLLQLEDYDGALVDFRWVAENGTDEAYVSPAEEMVNLLTELVE